MYCKQAELENFRNIKKASVEFCPGFNVLVGENAQGKTNLLEAIFYASVGRSFRAKSVGEMIMFGEKRASISVEYQADGKERPDRLDFEFFGDKKKTVQKNHLKVEKMSDIVGSFRAVLFCPEHLALIKEGPSERRSYLDIAISRISPKYIHSLQRYSYFLKQRNALIKNALRDRVSFDATIELWSEKLAEESAVISKMRVEFTDRISSLVDSYFCDMMSDSERVEMIYRGSAGLQKEDYLNTELVKQKYAELLSNSYDREISAGATLWGIHKDDVEIKLNGKNARNFASQGQQRSLALAMKLAEGEICKEEFGDYPVFLFDDVLSELDDTRRDYMILQSANKQVIISTCEIEFALKMNADRRISVKNGVYTEF